MCQPDPAAAPSVLVAAGFHGSFCPPCFASGLPSLCSHKPPVWSASLCVLDVRCPGSGVTARYSAMHRSIFPAIRASRGHYIFTSHGSTPMAAWDLRKMGAGPLYQEERLPGGIGGGDGDEVDDEDEDTSSDDGASLGQWTSMQVDGASAAMGAGEREEELQNGEVEQQQAAAGTCQGVGARAAAAAPARHAAAAGIAAEPAGKTHHALWLEASEDELLGRDELGILGDFKFALAQPKALSAKISDGSKPCPLPATF
ncbi:hypothetical protein MNEG_13666 [Monoraphidium neglectum]|uniref:Uncharacterized protein n=1 Tax=Monoraphidium neglectum TaxID=145388 RepID=A0A0D2LXR5_9CHLO|nr:hypothetical protein MNEG_13666 [Monoraphidium neglectum]KIY94296.1 hypothetical protein MNEG_13666 [Monoraphidium neglectum]|eukprot:XP_013893316.1 hypothetical protein MNEG_13666 [Monoraphidium neglectum]